MDGGEGFAGARMAGPPARESAARRGATRGQITTGLIVVAVAMAVALTFPVLVWTGVVTGAWALFAALALWRIGLILASRRPRAPVHALGIPPRYTVIAALYHEAAILPQLVERLSRLDYPASRLQGILALEADDAETLAAARAANLPAWLKVLVVPPGVPRTKPRALNHALSHAIGELVTVYDAEDEPHPGQLREAAARFVAGGGELACLQAPLRIRLGPGRYGFLERQFAAEYAALFEVALPGLARLGLPFPLGGTSNHFRASALREVGGWDPWNVTEDADLGFRLWRRGWRLGVLTRPTHETPAGDLDNWLPQRTRWLKGYMQTWGVHMRAPWGLGLRGMVAFQLTIGLGILSAAIHGLTATWIVALALAAATIGLTPQTPPVAVLVFCGGLMAAWASCWVGASRAGFRYGVRDALSAPLYWSLMSLAFAHAAWRLCWQPFAWDKTEHEPEASASLEAVAAGRHAA